MDKSKKLLKLTVNDGMKDRTILSGIAEYFKPEEVVGKQVSFLANLAPRKMMGLESEGMILMAEDSDGSLSFVQPDKKIWNGAIQASKAVPVFSIVCGVLFMSSYLLLVKPMASPDRIRLRF